MPEVKKDLLQRVKDARKRVKENVEGSDVVWYDPQDGERIVRFLCRPGDDYFFQERATHWDVGPDSKPVRCPKHTNDAGKPCAVCEYRELLLESAIDEDLAEARALKPKVNFLFNLIDREEERAGVKVWTAPQTVFDVIGSYIEDEDYGAVWDPDEGFDFIVIRKKSGSAFDYKASRFKRQPSSLSEDSSQVERWLEGCHDLKELARPATWAETYEALTGESPEEASEGGEQPEPEEEPEPEPEEEIEPEEEKDYSKTESVIREKMEKLKKQRAKKK